MSNTPVASDYPKPSRDLRDGVDGTSARGDEAAWREHDRKKDKRNRASSLSPHISEPYASLEELSMRALRRYGDMHPGTVDGEVIMMFLDFANEIIEELRLHPYWENPEIDYYTHPAEVRPIPDAIIVAGLLFHYAAQQQSDKVQTYGPMFYRAMNRILFSRKFGSGRAEVTPWDMGGRR
jgi:hypothetical protein